MTTSSATTTVPLGTIIFRAGLLTEEQLEEALAEGIKRGKRLGQVLIERGLLQESDLARLLAEQRGLEFVSLAERGIDPAAARVLPQEDARLNHALPIGFDDGVPLIAIDDPADEVVMRNVRSFVGDVRFVVATRSEIMNVLARPEGDAAPRAVDPAEPSSPQGSNGAADASAACRLFLRLVNGEQVEVGAFRTAQQATEEARSVITRLSIANAAEWPFFDGRFVRPESIVSVDVVSSS